MRCETTDFPTRSTTIIRPPTTLNRLPAASEVDFGGRPPWAAIPTCTLVAALHLDRGLWATWRCRGIGPAELPATWFRPASGRPCYYVASTVLAWLEARQGRPFDHQACWVDFLRTKLGDDWADVGWVRQLAAQQWLIPKGEVPFTRTGLNNYLDTLAVR